MSNRNITVGIFVAAGVSLFTFGIFLIGNQQKAFARHFDVYTEFANLDGVAKGAKVRVAGMDAGEVVDIAVSERPSANFRLKLRIEQRLHVLVRTDSVVTIATEGVVGDKFLLVHPGGQLTSEAASLTTLPSEEPLDLSDLMEKSAGMLKDVNGMMKQVGVPILLSATSILRNGFLSRQRKVRSSVATRSFSIALIIWPMASRAAQRLMLATASFASTGSPSWNFRLGRRRKVHTRPSGDTVSASTICRCGTSLLSTP